MRVPAWDGLQLMQRTPEEGKVIRGDGAGETQDAGVRGLHGNAPPAQQVRRHGQGKSCSQTGPDPACHTLGHGCGRPGRIVWTGSLRSLGSGTAAGQQRGRDGRVGAWGRLGGAGGSSGPPGSPTSPKLLHGRCNLAGYSTPPDYLHTLAPLPTARKHFGFASPLVCSRDSRSAHPAPAAIKSIWRVRSTPTARPSL